ncbi:MAG: FMN-binding protein [Reichenbachiella sp.]
MSEESKKIAQESTSSIKMLVAMVGIGTLCALLIVLSYEGTLPRIQRLRAEALEQAIFKVVPGTVQTQAFYYDEQKGFVPHQGEKDKEIIYAGFDEAGALAGIAIEANGQGYADIIKILYGYDPVKQTVIGFYVLESKETPGLGDKIEKKASFLDNFVAMDVKLAGDLQSVINQVLTVKQGAKENAWEVEGITGATISSRAVGKMLGESTQRLLPLIYANQEKFVLTNSTEQTDGE